ncbi:hypothetical protein KVR01_006485 [Diaporthe batatas]|uniref:uncharacterized protein n=1 Tax=Diaporthe batatas TaxID=748121 RepID=UPI001D046D10|nr:uncharacterized protein KVR01_006485 [Diaporthe batatas]KAG8164567.1 hypothetical protein KVR01_006485 [Diaporthe batatas]
MSQIGSSTPGKAVSYRVALSYVWSSALRKGGGQPSPTDRLMLQRDNLSRFRQPGFLSPGTGVVEELPLVVRDSMELVRLCGVRYLWVDCLCIAQHDETTAVQVSFMREIYSGAYFTIIAAADSEGLYGSGTNLDSVTNGVGQVSPGLLHGALLGSHWATRGWTFQEQVLSKRSLVFLDATAFWDCQGAVWWSESLVGSQTSADNTHEPPRQALWEPISENSAFSSDGTESRIHKADRQLSQDIAALSIPNFRLYMEIICRYNHRSLTYDQDALPAISGVLDAFAQGFPGGFVCGLPAVFLDASLLWQPRYKAKRRVAVGSVENVAPRSALPSWSWASWQCLIDPKSLESGLDYEIHQARNNNKYFVPHLSTTRGLVNWFILAADGSEVRIHGPEVLERCKELMGGGSRGVGNPPGWSHKEVTETYLAVGNDGGSPAVRLKEEQRQSDWYFYGSDTATLYRYPLPTQLPQPHLHSQTNSPFLSCTTTTATFKVRRVLVPQVRVTPTPRYGGLFDVSVLDTVLYSKQPELEQCCPVITLEDDRKRWAGTLRSMDDDLDVEAGQIVHLVAISRGSASYHKAALLYEERVDRVACFQFGSYNSDHYHFGLPGSVPRTVPEDCGDPESGSSQRQGKSPRWARTVRRNAAGSVHVIHDQWGDDPESDSECYKNMETEAATGLDQGPFFRRGFGCTKNLVEQDLPLGWRDTSYDFYNVLWVWRSGDVMYRKAAGRVPKDIWEGNCGPLQKITLG